MRPYRPPCWPDNSEDGRVEAAVRRRLAQWLPSNLVYLRHAVARVGARFTEKWDDTEIEARPRLAPPRKHWREQEEGGEARPVSIYNESGTAHQVNIARAEEWWAETEPRLRQEWKLEFAAHRRWQDAVARLRDELAQGRLVASVLEESGRTLAIEPEYWCSPKAELTFYLGLAEVTTAAITTVYKHKGVVVLDRAPFEEFVRPPGASPQGVALTASGDGVPGPPLPAIDPLRFPYLEFMIRAAREAPIAPDGRTPKKSIEAWLYQNWPQRLGEPTANKVATMATFLRRPEDEKGGNL